MQIKSFKPRYTITPEIEQALSRLEAAKERINNFPITPQALASLRETAQLKSVYYSTMIAGSRLSFAQVRRIIQQYKKKELIHDLDPKQRKVLALFARSKTITARQVGKLFNFQPRTSAHLCKKWVDAGFLVIVDPSNKGRTYGLAKKFKQLR